MMNRRALFLSAGAFLLTKPAFATSQSRPVVGLIFIARSDCPYCQAISPILWDAHLKTRMSLLVVSLDGRAVAPIPEWIDGRLGHPVAAVDRVPHVYVHNRLLDALTHEVAGFRNGRHFVNRLSNAIAASSAMS